MNFPPRFLLGIALSLPWLTAAGQIQLKPAKTLKAGNSNITPGSYATPIMTDWNGDGRKDLLLGYQPAGKIALYLNVGTDAQPAFGAGANLQYLEGHSNVWRDINHPSGGCGAPAPWACDFDADGRRDLLVGAGEDGAVWFYRNTNTDSHPKLAHPTELRCGNGFVNVASRAIPLYHDWDEDGLPDLICGSGEGYVYFFRNTNTVQSPWFAPRVAILAGGTNLFLVRSAGGMTTGTPRSVPRVVDWNGDGIKDLVCGSDVGAFWCRNVGSNPQPVLEAPVPLYAPTNAWLQPLFTGPRMRIATLDWNNDGTVDLLVGNADGTTQLYEGYLFGITSLLPQPDGSRLLKWNSCETLTYRVLARDNATGIETVVASGLPSAGATTTWMVPPSTNNASLFRVQVTPADANP